MHPLVDGFYKGRAVLKKRAIGQYFDNDKKPKAACYTGAIYYGLYKKTSVAPVIDMVADGYTVFRAWAEPPCDCDSENVGTIAGILIHLNDFHDGRQFSDQKITDWLIIALNNNYPTREALENASI